MSLLILPLSPLISMMLLLEGREVTELAMGVSVGTQGGVAK